MLRILYYGFFVAAVLQSLVLKSGWTRFGLITSLLMRLVPGLLLHVGVAYAPSVFDVICDGLFMAVLTSDLTLAKMAGRELHPWVVVMSLAACLSYTVILLLVATYFIAVMTDLCCYLNLPLFANCRNVYCDGGELQFACFVFILLAVNVNNEWLIFPFAQSMTCATLATRRHSNTHLHLVIVSLSVS
jgi:hypothetical protein